MRGRTEVVMGGKAMEQRGFWIISPAGNWKPRCLQAGKDGITSSATFNIANSSVRQRWLILGSDEAGMVETAAIDGMKAVVMDALDCLKKLMAVPHAEDVDGTDDSANATIARIESAIAGATDIRLGTGRRK